MTAATDTDFGGTCLLMPDLPSSARVDIRNAGRRRNRAGRPAALPSQPEPARLERAAAAPAVAWARTAAGLPRIRSPSLASSVLGAPNTARHPGRPAYPVRVA